MPPVPSFESGRSENTMREIKEKGTGGERMRVPNQETQYLSSRSFRMKGQIKQGGSVGEERALMKQFQ